MKLNRCLQVAALVAGLLASSAQAVPITRHFEFSSAEGPLRFENARGQFTYDSDLAVIGQWTTVFGGQIFDDVRLSFAGRSYSKSNGIGGWLGFDSQGVLVDVAIGSDCPVDSCIVSGSYESWSIGLSTDTRTQGNRFAYGGFNGARYVSFSTDVRFLDPTEVPEGHSSALLGAGLLSLMLVSARRRRN